MEENLWRFEMALRARSRAPQDENASVVPHLSGLWFLRILPNVDSLFVLASFFV